MEPELKRLGRPFNLYQISLSLFLPPATFFLVILSPSFTLPTPKAQLANGDLSLSIKSQRPGSVPTSKEQERGSEPVIQPPSLPAGTLAAFLLSP